MRSMIYDQPIIMSSLLLLDICYHGMCHVLRPGGYSLEFLVGVCRPHLQIQIQFQTKNAISHTRFQTWLQKSIPVFRPDLVRYLA